MIAPAGDVSTIAGGGYGYESQGQPGSGIEFQLGGVAVSGANWACPAGGTSCTRNDPLYSAGNYEPVTVTVKVAPDAPSPVVNLVSVSSSGFLGASATDTTPVLARCNVTSDTTTSVVDVQRIVNEALGVIPAVDDLNSDGVVNVADTQVVANAVLHLGCTL